MAKQHNRSASASSDVLSTETVSTFTRFFFANPLRSQRHLVRFILGIVVFFTFIYLMGPFSSSPKRIIHDDAKSSNTARSVAERQDTEKPVTEYRATFFEELGKKFANNKLSNNIDKFHFSNELKADEKTGSDNTNINSNTDTKANDDNSKEKAKLASKLSAAIDAQTLDSQVEGFETPNNNLTAKLDGNNQASESNSPSKQLADNKPASESDSAFGVSDVEIKVKSDAAFSLSDIETKVKSAASKLMKCREVPGMALVLVKGGESVTIPLGSADVATKRPVNGDTRFLLNSISKTFLGQLLAVIITKSEGKLSWDTKVVDLLGPSFQLATEELTREVTLRDLLSHRSGLSSGNLAVRATLPASRSRLDVVRQMKHLPPSVPFRKSFLYSNMGGLLATVVAETLGGASWEKLMTDFLLNPLGMRDSKPLASSSDFESGNFSGLYVPVEGVVTKADGKIFDQGPLSSVALLSTTPSDMAKWLQFNLRKGRLPDGRQLIRPDVWADMWKKQADLSPLFLAGVAKTGNEWPVKDASEGYGLFWFINRYRGLTNYWHGGGLYTHYTLAWNFPEKDVAIYAVINGYSGDAKPFTVVEAISYYAADLLLGYQPWLDESSICTYPHPWVKVLNQTTVKRNDSELASRLKFAGIGSGFDAKVTEKIFLPFVQKLRQQDETGKNQKMQQDETGDNLNGNPDLQPRSENVNPKLRSRYENAENGDDPINYKSDDESSKLLPGPRLNSYQGWYVNPLFGNFSVTFEEPTGKLACQMNILTGILHPTNFPQLSANSTRNFNQFGVELTGSLRFLSKPSASLAAKNAFLVEFVESRSGEVIAVDVHSSWSMEVPLRFHKVR